MIENNPQKIGGLLLAAGGSRRFGRPKQLLEFEGVTLLRRSVAALAGSKCSPVVIVLGAETERSKHEISDQPISIAINPDWESGMSSSIRVGLETLLKLEPTLDAVMITLCDQPFVTAAKIDLFIERFGQDRDRIVAAEYSGTWGVPALFSRQMFDELMKLEGDKGARGLIRNAHNLVTIDLPEAAMDIDLPADATRLRD